MYIPFNQIDDQAKCWVYILEEEINFISEDFNKIFIEICEKWTSHNTSVVSSFKIFKNRYIVLFAEEGVSGCSIDNSNRLIRGKLNELNLNIMPNSKIGIFINDKLKFQDKTSIINLIKSGKLKTNDKMINTTIKNKEEFNKNWILEINKSWLTNFIK
tara:strand:- start:68 stop:541 length:474 start_codon:yes stop_codon:yes gene_type:complete